MWILHFAKFVCKDKKRNNPIKRADNVLYLVCVTSIV